MANSITGIVDDIISQTALESFVQTIAPLNAFSLNISADAARPGDRISVLRELYPDEAAADKVSHGAYTIQDADAEAVEVVLAQPKYVSWSLDDSEVANSSVLNMERFGAGKGNKLAVAVLQDIWDQITNANYGAAVFTDAATAFDADDVADIKDAMDDDDIPMMGRSLVLSNAYLTNLLKDNAIQGASNFASSDPIREGVIGRLMGFDVFSSNVIPDNSENLTGFACVPGCMTVAMRYLQPQEGNTYSIAQPLQDPSGITLGIRDWYDNASGTRNRVLECVFGKNTGRKDIGKNVAGCYRIVSA